MEDTLLKKESFFFRGVVLYLEDVGESLTDERDDEPGNEGKR